MKSTLLAAFAIAVIGMSGAAIGYNQPISLTPSATSDCFFFCGF